MSNCAMSNETELDWLARNVHKWPAGDHQPWCYVYMTYGGVMKAAGNFLDAVANPAMITIDQWLARRAELQNKPRWKDAPEWAVYMAQSPNGHWEFFAEKPRAEGWWRHPIGRSSANNASIRGAILGEWCDTLEKRPEEFKPFTSIEDNQEQDMSQQHEMKQDNGWFERGELPPVGAVCEIHHQLWSGGKFEAVKISAITKDYLIVEYERYEQHYLRKDMSFRPIRTEREVAIDEMQSDIAERWANCEELAKYLVDKGWVKAGK